VDGSAQLKSEPSSGKNFPQYHAPLTSGGGGCKSGLGSTKEKFPSLIARRIGGNGPKIRSVMGPDLGASNRLNFEGNAMGGPGCKNGLGNGPG